MVDRPRPVILVVAIMLGALMLCSTACLPPLPPAGLDCSEGGVADCNANFWGQATNFKCIDDVCVMHLGGFEPNPIGDGGSGDGDGDGDGDAGADDAGS